MQKALTLFSILLATWFVLSGFFSPLFIILGVVSCALAVWSQLRLHPDYKSTTSFSHLIQMPAYSIWLIKEIILSSFAVAKIVWQPNITISPVFAWIPTAQRESLSQTIFANSITLTPGTVTVLVRGNQIGVHALSQSGIDDLWKGDMDRRVSKLNQGGVL
jgi:multicomponent Na+:H+ antiporter subunit E